MTKWTAEHLLGCIYIVRPDNTDLMSLSESRCLACQSLITLSTVENRYKDNCYIYIYI